MSEKRDISNEVVTYRSAKDVADELGISPVTLKKYSLAIEKLSNEGVLFHRNDDKSRVYTVPDVLLISRTLEERSRTGVSYEKAVMSVLKEEKILPVPDVPNAGTGGVPVKSDSSGTPEAFLAVLEDQNDRIDRLIEVNKELANTNKELSQKMEILLGHLSALQEPKDEQEEELEPEITRKKWWQFW